MVGNVYFDLTREFNAQGPVAMLGSGQAVVYYRVAIMSKDGDWVIRETPVACARVLEVLAARRARYRPGAPLDVRWLAGGWSSHFEFADERGRRVRCDFFSRPPRVPPSSVQQQFDAAEDPLCVVDLETLILMKRTQRAKDYAVIGELAARLPSEREIEVTTDVDRLLALAPRLGTSSQRAAVRAASTGDRDATVVALAREADALRRADRERLDAFAEAAGDYLRALSRVPVEARRLPEAHSMLCDLAGRWLPARVAVPGDNDASAQ